MLVDLGVLSLDIQTFRPRWLNSGPLVCALHVLPYPTGCRWGWGMGMSGNQEILYLPSLGAYHTCF